MIVHNEREALCVAVEMEKRAIRIYERALMLVEDEAVRAGITMILQQEKEHLRQFTAMREKYPAREQEENTLLQALGAETLFPGGVMEMERAKGLVDLKGMYRFAAESEKHAVESYQAFASSCHDSKVADAFRSIAAQESVHFMNLSKQAEK